MEHTKLQFNAETGCHVLKRTIQYTFDNSWKCTNTHLPLLSLIKFNKVQSIVCATFHELWVTLTRAEWSTRMGKGGRAMHAGMRDLVFAKNVQLSYVISHVPLSRRIRGMHSIPVGQYHGSQLRLFTSLLCFWDTFDFDYSRRAIISQSSTHCRLPQCDYVSAMLLLTCMSGHLVTVVRDFYLNVLVAC